jgi:hypothetical protein
MVRNSLYLDIIGHACGYQSRWPLGILNLAIDEFVMQNTFSADCDAVGRGRKHWVGGCCLSSSC